MRPTGRRRGPRESFNPPPPSIQLDFHHRQFPTSSARDSDASFASSRPSSAVVGRSTTFDLYKDRSFQQSAVSTINSYLSSLSFPISFKSTFPSAKDIHETLKFLLSRLEFPTSKLEEDLTILLKSLNYPFKLNKSILKSPAAPHQWPTFLALIHWLVQIAMYNDHLSSSFGDNNVLYSYTLESYLLYIRGDDDAVEALDLEWREKLEREKGNAVERVKGLEQEVAKLSAKVEGLKSQPSQREVLEKEKNLLEEDVNKFHRMIEELTVRAAEAEKVLVEKEKQLEAKAQENKRICGENEELKKRVELQTFNARDVERMRRELQAVERDTGEAELARNAWEEKSWELDTTLGHKFKELEALAMECNQATRRLKIGNGFQYVLNTKGSTPAEIMSIDYKSTVKPALNSFADNVKKGSIANLEELISLQQQSSETAARIEGKRKHIASLQLRIDEMEAELNILKKEMEDFSNRCAADAKKMVEDLQLEAHNLDIVEREAAEVLKASKLKLQEAVKQSEEEIQMRARDLFMLVDSVSKYKEYMESKIAEMKNDLSATAAAVSDAYKGSLPAPFSVVFAANH
ncbi:kinetochore protein NDC80-like [Quillaja saponaria]|uniref:Kinetochore protein NDC80 n=1 Tax=Quillaja saponaria TaxID=32244 RepID=A0AAD7M188_QUISA|nr:kinetochore protein NDC80-like [Quillaja saponaria]